MLLAELIVLDIDYRRRRGESPTKKEYIDRFPESSKAIQDAFNVGDQWTGACEPPTVGRLTSMSTAIVDNRFAIPYPLLIRIAEFVLLSL